MKPFDAPEKAATLPDRLRRAPGAEPVRGRGATFNPLNRFRRDAREACDDGWGQPEEAEAEPRQVRTTVTIERTRGIIARNDSSDIPFTQSINPYQGCEHGCIYCYARPSHAYLDLSPASSSRPSSSRSPTPRSSCARRWRGPVTSATRSRSAATPTPYQPIERAWRVTRQILEVLCAHQHPFSIVTKSALVERDIDLIAPMVAKNMARVYLSITTLDRDLARKLEPRAAAPARRLQAMRTLSSAGIPTGVLVAPVIPHCPA